MKAAFMCPLHRSNSEKRTRITAQEKPCRRSGQKSVRDTASGYLNFENKFPFPLITVKTQRKLKLGESARNMLPEGHSIAFGDSKREMRPLGDISPSILVMLMMINSRC